MRFPTRAFLGLGAAVVLMVGLGVFTRTTSAFAPYSTHSLNGTYVGGVVEIRQDDPLGPVQYCDEHGTFTFDGLGDGTVDNIRRCTDAGGGVPDVAHDVLTLTYTVSSTGIVELSFSSGDGGIAQLADNGKIAFVSTALAPASEDPHIFVRHGSIAKQ